jgi:hypothetical protein
MFITLGMALIHMVQHELPELKMKEIKKESNKK